MSRVVAANTNNFAGPGNEGKILYVVRSNTSAIKVRGLALQFPESPARQKLHDASGKLRVDAGNRDNDVVLSNANLFTIVVNERD